MGLPTQSRGNSSYNDAAACRRTQKLWRFFRVSAHKSAMRRDFDPEDYALVAKLRANPPNPWKWEIYCAGKRLPVEQSSTYFDSRGSAQAAGKKP
jgi:hypothetical protein